MASRTKWEYAVHVARVRQPPIADLNRRGQDGWELTSVAGIGELGAIEELWCFFKRPSLSERKPRTARVR